MPARILLLLIFCGHSSSLFSVYWDRPDHAMVSKKSYPYMAYVIGDDGEGCSATISSLTATLTAASCIVGDKKMEVWAGTNRLIKRVDFEPPTQHRRVAKVSIFSEDEMNRHDIGIAWLHSPWTLDEYVRPIPFWIQTPLLNFEFLEDMVVLGWGYGHLNVTNRVLRRLTVAVGSSVMCPLTGLQHERNIMCSIESELKTACKGDKGGGLIANFPLVGVVQMGVVKGQVPEPPLLPPLPEHTALDPTCQLPSVPIMYTYVGFYREWLLGMVDNLSDFWRPPTGSVPQIGKGPHHSTGFQKLERRSVEATGAAVVLTSQRLLLVTSCLLLLPAAQRHYLVGASPN